MLYGQINEALDSIDIKMQKEPSAFIALDLFSPIYGLFTDKKGLEILATYPLKRKLHLAAEVGYEQNRYMENSWDAEVSGPFARLGAQYFISLDNKDSQMGFYLGSRFAYANYQQTIHSFLVQGSDGNNTTSSLPEHKASAWWFEPLAGGRVSIFQSPFYIDASIRLKINITDNNPYHIDPLVIPGFGTDRSNLSLGVNWSIGYALPF
ncbi:hypothetical protein GO491_10190 [Flavobacteriaceae bacterium Ap0902]|nr:hypothetical protein [Flavobacteriaceae bacterium Ap0902]